MSKKRNKKRSNRPLHPADAGITMICKCCQRELTLDKFYAGAGNRYARRLYCKTCYTEEVRHKNSLNSEKVLFIKRKWQKKFKNQKNKTNREYYSRNKETISAKELERYHRKRREKLAQNIHQIGQCILNTVQSQNPGVESPLAQMPELSAVLECHFLLSCLL